MDRVSDTSARPMHWVEANLAIDDVDVACQWAMVAAETRLLPHALQYEFDFALNAYNDPGFEEPRFVELRRKLWRRESLWRTGK